MLHTSRNGSIYRDNTRSLWTARIAVCNRTKCYSSPYREDCERWLNGMRDDSLPRDPQRVRQEIIHRGGINPRQIPDYPYFLTDTGDLWSAHNNRLRMVKLSRRKYYVLTNCGHSITCTLEKLLYCIRHNVSPQVLNRCKLSVDADTHKLIDSQEYASKCRADNRRNFLCHHAENLLDDTEAWCRYMRSYYKGNEDAVEGMYNILSKQREWLMYYIQSSLRLSDARAKYIADEVISETLSRAIERKALILSPFTYMKRLSRRINYELSNKKYDTNRLQQPQRPVAKQRI